MPQRRSFLASPDDETGNQEAAAERLELVAATLTQVPPAERDQLVGVVHDALPATP